MYQVKKIQDVSENRRNYIESLKGQLVKSKDALEEVKVRYEECKTSLERKTGEMREVVKRQEMQNKSLSELKVKLQFCAIWVILQFHSHWTSVFYFPK